MKKTELKGYVYHFSVDYDSTDADDILDIHKCLMKQHDTKEIFDLLENVYWIIKRFYKTIF